MEFINNLPTRILLKTQTQQTRAISTQHHAPVVKIKKEKFNSHSKILWIINVEAEHHQKTYKVILCLPLYVRNLHEGEVKKCREVQMGFLWLKHHRQGSTGHVILREGN